MRASNSSTFEAKRYSSLREQRTVIRGAEALAFTTTPTDERLAPGDGPPLHRHPWVTWEVVVEGTVRARVGDETYDLGPGDLFFTPPDVPHTFMTLTDARLIGINWPGGFHHLYEKLASAFPADGPPDFAAMSAAAAEHGAEILGPPLAVLEGEG